MHTRPSDPLDAAMLALEYDTAMLAGALVGRLALDRRVDDANQLACLLTATNIGRGLSDLDTPIALAHAFDATTLAAALVGRLSLDGRMNDANKLALLFAATNIGTPDSPALAFAARELVKIHASARATLTVARPTSRPLPLPDQAWTRWRRRSGGRSS